MNLSPYTRSLQFKVAADQVLDGTKTATRRGRGVTVGKLCRATRGPPWTMPFVVLRILSCEAMDLVGPLTPEEVAKEGFPGKSPSWFVNLYREVNGLPPGSDPTVYRIGFEVVGMPGDTGVRAAEIWIVEKLKKARRG